VGRWAAAGRCPQSALTPPTVAAGPKLLRTRGPLRARQARRTAQRGPASRGARRMQPRPQPRRRPAARASATAPRPLPGLGAQPVVGQSRAHRGAGAHGRRRFFDSIVRMDDRCRRPDRPPSARRDRPPLGPRRQRPGAGMDMGGRRGVGPGGGVWGGVGGIMNLLCGAPQGRARGAARPLVRAKCGGTTQAARCQRRGARRHRGQRRRGAWRSAPRLSGQRRGAAP
jgi:hypothetical protein